jgi:hypothetical protein
MIIRWISLVPSKIVKIFAQGKSHRYTPAALTCRDVDSQGFR